MTYAAIEYRANQPVENVPGSGGRSTATTTSSALSSSSSSGSSIKGKKRLMWKGTKRPSIQHVASFENDKPGDVTVNDASRDIKPSTPSRKASRPLSWLGSKTRTRKSVPALPTPPDTAVLAQLVNTPPPRHASEGFSAPPEFTTELQTYSPALTSEGGCSSSHYGSHAEQISPRRPRAASYATTTTTASSTAMSRGWSAPSAASSSSFVNYGDKIVDPHVLLTRQFSLDMAAAPKRTYHASHSFGTFSLQQQHLTSTESFTSMPAHASSFDSDVGSDCNSSSGRSVVITPASLRTTTTPRHHHHGLSPAPMKRSTRTRARTLSRVTEAVAAAAPLEEAAKMPMPTPVPRLSPIASGKRFAFLAPESKFCITPTFGEVEWDAGKTQPRPRPHIEVNEDVSPKTRASPGGRFSLDCPTSTSTASPPASTHGESLSRKLSRKPTRPEKHHQRAKSLHASSAPSVDASLPPPPPLPSRDAGTELGLGITCA